MYFMLLWMNAYMLCSTFDLTAFLNIKFPFAA